MLTPDEIHSLYQQTITLRDRLEEAIIKCNAAKRIGILMAHNPKKALEEAAETARRISYCTEALAAWQPLLCHICGEGPVLTEEHRKEGYCTVPDMLLNIERLIGELYEDPNSRREDEHVRKASRQGLG